MSAESRLLQLGLTLGAAPRPVANYVAWRIGGGLLFLSGVGPHGAEPSVVHGQVGTRLTIEQGYAAARGCGLNLLAQMREALGSLDRVACVLKVLGMVNSAAGFAKQPEVINGCTDLFVEVFGESGRPARSAVGMSSLPRDISVEIEAVVLIRA